MNVKIIIVSLLIGLVIGIVAAGITGYYIFYRPTISSIRTELDASRRDAELYRSRAEESERRINDVSRIIDESTTNITGTISTIQQARTQIRAVIETLRKVREMVKNKELDYGG